MINKMLQPPLKPNRVPKSTYDELKLRYDELIVYVQNREGEREFFRRQEKRRKFQIVSSTVLMVIGFILILISIINLWQIYN